MTTLRHPHRPTERMVEPNTMVEDASPNDLERLFDILSHPEKRILPLLYSSGKEDDEKTSDPGKLKTLNELLEISKGIFADIESMSKQYQALHEKSKATEDGEDSNNKDNNNTFILSGLNELYIPPEVDATDKDLPETIFGQVDLQTAALAKLVKKSTKRLKATNEDEEICILDMGVMDSGDEDGDSSDENDDSSDGESDNSVEENDNDDENEEFSDEEAERIRKRMERAMEDMEDEDDDSDSDEVETVPKKEEKEEELYDPVAEDMKDGFFDLNEMEAFADEEEDFLPNEAFGQPSDEGKRKNETKKSFHQRQREGLNNDSDDDDDDDESDLDGMYEEVRDVKRKKYREQEDIDALYELYQETNPGDDEDEDDDIVNMTAADFFGAPKKQYIERYKKNHPHGKNPAQSKGDDDDDSWGEYDFDKEDQGGWRDDDDDGDDNASYDDEEEMEDMKDPATDGAEMQVPERQLDDRKKLTKSEEKLLRQTEELEKELINEKPWQMRGESKGTSRPVNSLLDGTPEFEMASKQAPTITVEHTMNLEEVIKQRILAEDWDDVVPRELPDIGWNKKRGEAPEVSQEKSKLGLGELYEREYLKKAVGYDKDAEEKQTEEDKAKDEMRQLFANLCSKLDALSNYHFAPRPIADEAEARAVTVPAIAMEEVLPLHVSDARGTAPEEVFATKRGREGILRTDQEMDQHDRKRQRQSKKAARRKARKEKEADEKLISRLQPGLGLNNPYEKRKAREELSMARARGKVVQGETDMDAKFGSSGTFFKRLQAEAQQSIQDQTSGDSVEKREKKSKGRSSAYKL